MLDDSTNKFAIILRNDYANLTRCFLLSDMDLALYYKLANFISICIPEELFYIQNFDYDKKAGLNTMISSLYHYGLFDQIECEQGGANYVLSDFAKALKSSSLNFDEGFYTEKRILTYNDIKPLNIAEPLSWENLDGGSY